MSRARLLAVFLAVFTVTLVVSVMSLKYYSYYKWMERVERARELMQEYRVVKPNVSVDDAVWFDPALREWWSNMSTIRLTKSSPLMHYITELRRRLSFHKLLHMQVVPDRRIADGYQVRIDWPKPGTVVKFGSWLLPYGARIDTLAFFDGPILNVIVYGTVVNVTDFLRLAAIDVVFHGVDFLGQPVVDVLTPDASHNPFYYFAATPDAKTFNYTKWIIWVAEVDGYHVKLRHTYTMKEGLNVYRFNYAGTRVYLILEEPIAYTTSTYLNRTLFFTDPALEEAWLESVAFPAYSLALRIAVNKMITNHTMYIRAALRKAIEVTRDVMLFNVSYIYVPSNFVLGYTPLENPFILYGPASFRLTGGGVCNTYTQAADIFMALALGWPSLYIYLPKPNHAVGAMLVPSSVAEKYGITGITVPIDVDGDGKNDIAIKVVDTAKYSDEFIERNIGSVDVFWPFAMPLPTATGNGELKFIYKYYGDATGLFNYTRVLPKWFTPPYWGIVEKLYPHKPVSLKPVEYWEGPTLVDRRLLMHDEQGRCLNVITYGNRSVAFHIPFLGACLNVTTLASIVANFPVYEYCVVYPPYMVYPLRVQIQVVLKGLMGDVPRLRDSPVKLFYRHAPPSIPVPRSPVRPHVLPPPPNPAEAYPELNHYWLVETTLVSAKVKLVNADDLCKR